MIQDIFALQNPWRKQTKYQFHYLPRDILPALISEIDNPKIIGLVGSRQVGKSSLLFLLIRHLLNLGIPKEHIFYFNLDDLQLRSLFLNIGEFIEFIGNRAKRQYIFIDEVQRLENPGLFLKELYDLKLNFKIFYSGSSQLEIRSKVKEYGVGRIRQFEVERLSFKEYLIFAKPIIKKEALLNYLIYGSYPEVALSRQNTERKMLLKDIYQNYLQKDVADFLKISNVAAFNKLLAVLANQNGGLLYLDHLSKILALSRMEIQNFLTVLEQTFIIKLIYPFFRNYKKEITKTAKMYFLDLGLRNFILSHFNEDILTRSDLGALFENFYFLQLLHSDPRRLQKINFWRTTNQTEIDFIVSDGENQKAIEVKYNRTAKPKSFKTIAKYYPKMQILLATKEDFLSPV